MLPVSQAGDDPESLAEERRLLYVGITRARQHLALSWAQQRVVFEREAAATHDVPLPGCAWERRAPRAQRASQDRRDATGARCCASSTGCGRCAALRCPACLATGAGARGAGVGRSSWLMTPSWPRSPSAGRARKRHCCSVPGIGPWQGREVRRGHPGASWGRARCSRPRSAARPAAISRPCWLV